jgi:hypothetical protein
MKKKDVQSFRRWYDDLLASAGAIVGENGYRDRLYLAPGWLDLTLHEPQERGGMLWIAGSFADVSAMRAWFGRQDVSSRCNWHSAKWNFQSWGPDITPVRAFHEFYTELTAIVPPWRHEVTKACLFFDDTKGLEEIWPPSPGPQHLSPAHSR